MIIGEGGGTKRGYKPPKVLGAEKVAKGGGKNPVLKQAPESRHYNFPPTEPTAPKDWKPSWELGSKTEEQTLYTAIREILADYLQGVTSARNTEKKNPLKLPTGKGIPMPEVKAGKDALEAEKWRQMVLDFNHDPRAWRT
jgi:hypothetical protein